MPRIIIHNAVISAKMLLFRKRNFGIIDKILADRLTGRHSLKQRADHLESTLLFTTLLHHAMPPIAYTATLSIKSTYLLSVYQTQQGLRNGAPHAQMISIISLRR